MIVCVLQSFRLHLDNKEAQISLLNDRLTVFAARFAQRVVKKMGVVNRKIGVTSKISLAGLPIQNFLRAPLLGTCMVIALNYPYYYIGPFLMDDGSFLLNFINTVCMGKGTLASRYTNLVF